MMCQLSVVESKSATFPSEKARHLLDDSVLESRSPRRGLALASSSAVTNGLALGKRLRPAHHSGWATARRVSVSVTVQCLVAPHPLQRGLPTGVTRAREAFASWPPRLHEMPWVCPHPAGGPESGRQAGQGPETRHPWPATAEAWSLPPRGSIPGEPWPPHVGQRRRCCPGTAAGQPPGAHCAPVFTLRSQSEGG